MQLRNAADLIKSIGTNKGFCFEAASGLLAHPENFFKFFVPKHIFLKHKLPITCFGGVVFFAFLIGLETWWTIKRSIT